MTRTLPTPDYLGEKQAELFTSVEFTHQRITNKNNVLGTELLEHQPYKYLLSKQCDPETIRSRNFPHICVI